MECLGFRYFYLEDGMKKKNIRRLTVIGILSSVAGVLMFVEFPLFFLPDFYKIDLSEIPVLIGAFAYGPVAGIIIEAIKNIIHLILKGTTTMGVGELANFLIGVSFVVPASIIYFRKKTRKHAVIGMTVGALSMAVMGALLNAFVLLPIYAFVYSDGNTVYTVADFVYLGTLANPLVDNSLFKFMIFSVVPFNLLKAIVTSILVILIYKRVSHIIKAKDGEKLG